jgi:hypothetical protein
LLPLKSVTHPGGEYVVTTSAVLVLLCLALSSAPSRGLGLARSALEPRDVETVSGEVVRVEVLPGAGSGARDVTLVLRTPIGDEVPVAVAPRRVVRGMRLHLHAGDDIQVTGWRIVRGKPALLAAEIGAGGRLFVFRDRYGNPVWPRSRLDRE